MRITILLAVLIVLAASVSLAGTLCPDGSYVGGSSCQLCPKRDGYAPLEAWLSYDYLPAVPKMGLLFPTLQERFRPRLPLSLLGGDSLSGIQPGGPAQVHSPKRV
jgi:hypothetical protein